MAGNNPWDLLILAWLLVNPSKAHLHDDFGLVGKSLKSP
jgi:hypothetical protein